MKSILVTGGAGFIGSNFIRMVLSEHDNTFVVNLDKLTYAGNLENLKGFLDNPNHKFIKGDICDTKLVGKILDEYKIEAIINFAAETHVDRSIIKPDEFMKTNVMGTFTLLEAGRCIWLEEKASTSGDFRFHHISTDEVFGSLGSDDPPFSESTPYNPSSPYAASKASSDHLVRAYYNTYGLPVVITNCSNNYGPYQFPEKVIP
ncbi:MAG: GDP-mannose 4,6-dehydratase, partial [Planctomycetes bacterium]|nr:GDP-mannose 4,6-dehydratase [Planctomycetota bacterium]